MQRFFNSDLNDLNTPIPNRRRHGQNHELTHPPNYAIPAPTLMPYMYPYPYGYPPAPPMLPPPPGHPGSPYYPAPREHAYRDDYRERRRSRQRGRNSPHGPRRDRRSHSRRERTHHHHRSRSYTDSSTSSYDDSDLDADRDDRHRRQRRQPMRKRSNRHRTPSCSSSTTGTETTSSEASSDTATSSRRSSTSTSTGSSGSRTETITDSESETESGSSTVTASSSSSGNRNARLTPMDLIQASVRAAGSLAPSNRMGLVATPAPSAAPSVILDEPPQVDGHLRGVSSPLIRALEVSQSRAALSGHSLIGVPPPSVPAAHQSEPGSVNQPIRFADLERTLPTPPLRNTTTQSHASQTIHPIGGSPDAAFSRVGYRPVDMPRPPPQVHIQPATPVKSGPTWLALPNAVAATNQEKRNTVGQPPSNAVFDDSPLLAAEDSDPPSRPTSVKRGRPGHSRAGSVVSTRFGAPAPSQIQAALQHRSVSEAAFPTGGASMSHLHPAVHRNLHAGISPSAVGSATTGMTGTQQVVQDTTFDRVALGPRTADNSRLEHIDVGDPRHYVALKDHPYLMQRRGTDQFADHPERQWKDSAGNNTFCGTCFDWNT